MYLIAGSGVILGGHQYHPRIILLSDGKATVDSTMPMEDRTTSRVQEALVRQY